jgi:hypothetical protein
MSQSEFSQQPQAAIERYVAAAKSVQEQSHRDLASYVAEAVVATLTERER